MSCGGPRRRPVLLLTRNSAYSYLNKFVVVELTTNVRGLPVEVPLGRAEGLKKPCGANFDNLRTVPKSLLVQRIGGLGQQRHVEVKRALCRALGWPDLISVLG